MKITLTGGTGFLGRRLVPRLLAEGHSVRLLVRQANTGFGPAVDCSLWNAYTMEPPPESFEGAEVVIHLAGEPLSQRWTPSARRRILDSRVVGTRRLVTAISKLERRPSVLIGASAIGIYGDRGEEVLTELSSPGKGFLAGVCAGWEREAGAAEALGLRIVKLRMGMILGKEGGALAQMLTPFQWGFGGQVGDGQQWMSWIHAEDLASLILFAIQHRSLAGPVNAVAPNPVRNSEFTATLSTVLRRMALLRMPAWSLRTIYGEMAEIILGSQHVQPKTVQEAGFEFRYPTLRGALQNLLA